MRNCAWGVGTQDGSSAYQHFLSLSQTQLRLQQQGLCSFPNYLVFGFRENAVQKIVHKFSYAAAT